MSIEPLVSVIIPTHNRSQTLPEAVQSVLAQTYGHLELIVVDDGSTDETEAALARFTRDSRFRYLQQENAGSAAARNSGVATARGELVAFLDSDDRWYAHKLERQVPLFGNPGVALVFSQRDWMDDEGNPIPTRSVDRYRGTRLYTKLLEENFVPTSTVVVRRNAIRRAGGFDEQLRQSQDYSLWLQMSLYYEFDFVDESLAIHRKWDGQITCDKLRASEYALQVTDEFCRRNRSLVSAGQQRRSLARHYARRGRALARLGRRTNATRDFMRSLWLHPTNISALKSLAKLPFGRI